ncbi:MAG: VWA domain-containing protein [Bacteroidia bacterium]|nr:VWA domain-containing protein [Bacteroidia bacterium]
MKNRTQALITFVGISLLMYAIVFGKDMYHNSRFVASTTHQKNVLTSPAIHHTDNTQVVGNRIQIALILDTSNSMDGLINQAKSQLWKIINELTRAHKDSTAADISIALYEYGNDNLPVTKGYIRQVMPFNTDLDLLSEKLFALTTNGGSEYCGQVIQTSLNHLDWSESDSSLKIIYIAGNEGFNQGPVPYTNACSYAVKNNVVINTIYCGNYSSGIAEGWREGALQGQGMYHNIDSDQEVVLVSTPYDQTINQLNLELNNTYVHYGAKGKWNKDNQLRQDLNQDKISSANSASRTLSKSSRLYYNGHWDLVDAYNTDNNIINNIDVQTLPDSLQTLEVNELEVYVEEMNEKRISINRKIVELGIKREEYIEHASDSLGKDNTLGSRMIKSLKRQASSKGFTFK